MSLRHSIGKNHRPNSSSTGSNTLLTPWIESLVYDTLLNGPWLLLKSTASVSVVANHDEDDDDANDDDDGRDVKDDHEGTTTSIIPTTTRTTTTSPNDTTTTSTATMGPMKNGRPKIVQVLAAVSSSSSSSSQWTTLLITDGTTSIIARVGDGISSSSTTTTHHHHYNKNSSSSIHHRSDIAPGAMLRIQNWDFIVTWKNDTTCTTNTNRQPQYVEPLPEEDVVDDLFQQYARIHSVNHTKNILPLSSLSRKQQQQQHPSSTTTISHTTTTMTPVATTTTAITDTSTTTPVPTTNTTTTTTITTLSEPSLPQSQQQQQQSHRAASQQQILSSMYLIVPNVHTDIVHLGNTYHTHLHISTILPVLDTINVRRVIQHIEQSRGRGRGAGGIERQWRSSSFTTTTHMIDTTTSTTATTTAIAKKRRLDENHDIDPVYPTTTTTGTTNISIRPNHHHHPYNDDDHEDDHGNGTRIVVPNIRRSIIPMRSNPLSTEPTTNRHALLDDDDDDDARYHADPIRMTQPQQQQQQSLPIGDIKSLFCNMTCTDPTKQHETTPHTPGTTNYNRNDNLFWDYIQHIPATTTTTTVSLSSLPIDPMMEEHQQHHRGPQQQQQQQQDPTTIHGNEHNHDNDHHQNVPQNNDDNNEDGKIPSVRNDDVSNTRDVSDITNSSRNKHNSTLPLGDISMLFNPSNITRTEATIREICKVRNQLSHPYDNAAGTTTNVALLSHFSHRNDTNNNTTAIVRATHATENLPHHPTDEPDHSPLSLPLNDVESTVACVDNDDNNELVVIGDDNDDQPRRKTNPGVESIDDDRHHQVVEEEHPPTSSVNHMDYENNYKTSTGINNHDDAEMADPPNIPTHQHNWDDNDVNNNHNIGIDQMLIESSDDENDDGSNGDIRNVEEAEEQLVATEEAKVVRDVDSSVLVPECGNAGQHLVIGAIDENDVGDGDDDGDKGNVNEEEEEELVATVAAAVALNVESTMQATQPGGTEQHTVVKGYTEVEMVHSQGKEISRVAKDKNDDGKDDVDDDEVITTAAPEEMLDVDLSTSAPLSGAKEQHPVMVKRTEFDIVDVRTNDTGIAAIDENGDGIAAMDANSDGIAATFDERKSQYVLSMLETQTLNDGTVEGKQMVSPAADEHIDVGQPNEDDISVIEILDSDDDIEILETQYEMKDTLPKIIPSTGNVNERHVDDADILKNEVPMETRTCDIENRYDADEGGRHEITLMDDTAENDLEYFQTQEELATNDKEHSKAAGIVIIAKETPVVKLGHADLIHQKKNTDDNLATQQETDIGQIVEKCATEQDIAPTTHACATLDVDESMSPDNQIEESETTKSNVISENDNISLEMIATYITENDEAMTLQTQPKEFLMDDDKSSSVAPSINTAMITSTNPTNIEHQNKSDHQRSKKRRKKEFCFGGDALRSLISYPT